MERVSLISNGNDLPKLGDRAAAILCQIVEEYVRTGEPVGSKIISERLESPLSPATIRNVKADLTKAGLLFSPHVSAGRLPTDKGLRLFVEGLLEFGSLSDEERRAIQRTLEMQGKSLQDILAEASTMLSGLSSAVGIVLAPQTESAVRHIEFVSLGNHRALVVLVGENGQVENRVIELPTGVSVSALEEATNYLNSRLNGQSIDNLRDFVREEMKENRDELN